MWVAEPDERGMAVWVEAHTPLGRQCGDFLVLVAEPSSRTAFIHEYVITSDSLYAAASLGVHADAVLSVLRSWSKVTVNQRMERYVRENGMGFGKARLLLEDNTFFIESGVRLILERLSEDPELRELLVDRDLPACERVREVQVEGETGEVEWVRRLRIRRDLDVRGVERVRKRCEELGYPLAAVFNFRQELEQHLDLRIGISLRPTTRLRGYQTKALARVFTGGRARSGIVVLPCGAGKTLVGVTACATMNMRTLVVCVNDVSVGQWLGQFRQWAVVEDPAVTTPPGEKRARVCLLTSMNKDSSVGDILLTTYGMLTHRGHRAEGVEDLLEEIQTTDWGLLVLDEVHIAPASSFREVIGMVRAHCVLGLTATLLREDDRIEHLSFLVGPKLFEGSWMDLVREGALAEVRCAEVHCKMTKEFYGQYLQHINSQDPRHRSRARLFYFMNPVKLWVTQALVLWHEQQGHKVLVYSDSIPVLRKYAQLLHRPLMHGETIPTERLSVLSHFRGNPRVNTVLVSRVGDVAVDLPEANVLIEISAFFGSRRQLTQRLGRILRPKLTDATSGGGCAYFYSLVSTDTAEMFWCHKRQQYLLDQGYSFKVVHADRVLEAPLPENVRRVCSTATEQANLLDEVRTYEERRPEREKQDEEREYNRAEQQRRNLQLSTQAHILFRKRYLGHR